VYDFFAFRLPTELKLFSPASRPSLSVLYSK
jgi:hypothetical protein